MKPLLIPSKRLLPTQVRKGIGPFSLEPLRVNTRRNEVDAFRLNSLSDELRSQSCRQRNHALRSAYPASFDRSAYAFHDVLRGR